MTTHDYGSDAPTSSDPKEQARQAAATARDDGRHVAEVARDEAQQVAADAQQQARNLIDDARSQLHDQSRSQLDNLVSVLQGFADDLEQMARGDGAGAGLARDVVTQASDRARSFGSGLQGREPGELLDQARDFARRKPGTFLLGALAAGVVAGRLARGAKDAHSDSAGAGNATGATGAAGVTPSQPSTPPGSGLPSAGQGLTDPVQQTGTAAADPLAGTGEPPAPPVYPEGTPQRPGGGLAP